MNSIVTGIMTISILFQSAPAVPAVSQPLHGYIYETSTTTGYPDGDPLFIVATCDGQQLYIPQENGLHIDQAVDVYPDGRITAAPDGADYLPFIRDYNRIPCPHKK